MLIYNISKKSIVMIIIILLILINMVPDYAGINITSYPHNTSLVIETDSLNDSILVSQKSLIKNHESISINQIKYGDLDAYYPRYKTTIIDDEDWDIIVPDDSPTIQKAIDKAGQEEGYRIFVRTGTYYEKITINTNGIMLHGENKETTIINANKIGNVINIRCNYVIISGFSIINSGINYAGIYVNSSSGNILQNNIITNNSNGVLINNHSHVNEINGNRIEGNFFHGVVITNISSRNIIYNNSISNNQQSGINIDNVSRGNTIICNTINDNNVGIKCTEFSDGNLFHHNSLIDNMLNAFDSSFNDWDNGEEGNFWSDYTGNDSNYDGIGDSPYSIPGGNNQDNYPLMNQTIIINQIEKESKSNCFVKSKRNINVKTRFVSFPKETIIVPDDFPTIQKAIDNANNGDRIEVRAGIYNENVFVDKSVEIIGYKPNVTIVDGNGLDKHVFQVSADNVEIAGFTIRNCTKGFSGIRQFRTFGDFHHNIINDCGGGIELWSTDNNSIHNNYIYDNLWGIYAHVSSNCTINKNNLSNNIYGIESGFSEIDIFNNFIGNNDLIGILQINSNYIIVQGNNISKNGGIGIQIFSSNSNVFKDNIFYKNSQSGLSLHKSTYNTIQNNIFQNHSSLIRFVYGYGIQLFYFSNFNNIHNNEFISNEVGVGIFFSDNTNILKNIFSNFHHYGDGIAIDIEDSNFNNIKSNNILNYWEGIKIWSGYLNTVYGNNIIGPGERAYGSFIFELYMPYFIFLQPGLYGITNWGYESLIFYNNISEHLLGIWTWGGLAINKIRGNNIYSNYMGIDVHMSWPNLHLSPSEISYNNFIGNKIDARFKEYGIFFTLYNLEWIERKFKDYPVFEKNYWNRPRYFPKIIHGRLGIVPWLMSDKNPAKKPYDIDNLPDFEKVDQYQVESVYPASTWYNCLDNVKLAQSFIPTLELIQRVDLGFWKVGNPESLKISIFKNLSGDELTSINIPASDIPDRVFMWMEFDFSDIHLISGEEYFIVWEPITNGIDDTFYQAFEYNNPYDRGCPWIYIDDHWEKLKTDQYQDIDFSFITWGG